MNKIKLGFFVFTLVLLLSSVNALYASIGNARMVLRPEVIPGQETILEQIIFVQNINPEKVNVIVEPEGNFSNYVTVLDNKFTLDINESLDARFTITLNEPGQYIGKVLVSFSAYDNSTNQTPIGLASNIIVIAKNATINLSDVPVLNESEIPNPKPKFDSLLNLILIFSLIIIIILIVVRVANKGEKK